MSDLNLQNIKTFFATLVEQIQPIYSWMFLLFWLILWLALLYKYAPKNPISVFFDMMFETAYNFFEEILWKEEKSWIKMYITLMFFIILFSNLIWVVLEFVLPIFWLKDWHAVLAHYVEIPTANINFNIAMAVIWVLIVILEQIKFLWFGKFVYEYFPVLWKNYIPFERWNLPKIIDLPVFLLVKIFDIIISLFLWLLEIVGHFAKIISLSFRLFWNVTAGWVLLAMLLGLFSFAWGTFDFPVIWPLILYMQELLVACIQALVFPLLIAIFIKVAKIH